MASKSYPRAGYNSGALTELEHERLVQAQAPDGLIGTPSDSSLVYADGTGTRVVKIRSGRRGLVRGSQYDSGDTDVSMPSLSANATGQPRIDLIVLRLSRTDYTVTEAAITGTPAASPTAPSPLADTGSTGSFDLPVAQVRVENGATAITADKVTSVAWYIGEDGQILCTPTTRPPHTPDRHIWETTTARELLSDGTGWRIVSDDSGAVTATITGGAAGWTASHNTAYRRNGWAFMQLTARRPTAYMFAGSAYLVASVPSGFRPPFLIQSTATVPSRGALATVTVGINGDVYVSPTVSDIPSNTSFVLSALSWPVA